MATKPALPTNTDGWPQAALDYATKAETFITKVELDLKESEALRRGTYYALLQHLGKLQYESYSDTCCDPIKRTEEFLRFKPAIDAAKNWEEGQEIAVSSGRSAGSRKRHTKKLKSTHIDGQNRQSGEIVHMLAYSTKCSSFWGEFVQGAAGVDFSKDANKESKAQALVQGIIGPDAKSRKKGTGMKHYRDNMARILHQGMYCNKKPALLALPIMSLEDVKKPPKEEYDVMIVCVNRSVYQELVLTEKAAVCSPAEIDMAVSRLNEFLQAAAFYLSNRNEEDFDVLGHDEKNKLKSSWERIRPGGVQEGQAPLFDLFDAERLQNIKVLKVKLSNGDNQLHSYVDPWLLLMKNAAMFSDIFGMKLLPGCGFDASEEEDSTSHNEDDDGSVPGIPGTISFTRIE